jgi:CBS domain-containing protein
VKNIKVKDLMTPIGDYAAVSRNATLRDALIALEKAEKRFEGRGDKPRAVLVIDEDDRLVGKLTAWDILRALEPKYKSIGDEEAVRHYGLSAAFIRSMVANYGLLEEAFDDICHRVARVEVGEVMTSQTEAELIHQERQVIEDEAGLNEAIHLFVMGDFIFLFVFRADQIVGILRLVDVVNAVSEAIKACPVEGP